MTLSEITRTRFRPDPVTMAAYGALAAGFIAGVGFGAAATLQFGPPLAGIIAPHPGLNICEPAPDDIGFFILLDEAKRKGVAAHV